MQTPSMKVTTQFLVTAMLLVVGQLLSDTSWTAWLPDQARPAVPVLLALLGAVAAYAKSETNPAASSYRFQLPDDQRPGE